MGMMELPAEGLLLEEAGEWAVGGVVSALDGVVGISVGSSVFFFFQAEDGIRDYKVTGVQTCALPISPLERRGDAREELRRRPEKLARLVVVGLQPAVAAADEHQAARGRQDSAVAEEIGRASCRERG